MPQCYICREEVKGLTIFQVLYARAVWPLYMCGACKRANEEHPPTIHGI